MQKYHDILKKYWGYDEFRPLQGDIIRSIAAGNDTLGLMPTGGGKSITFQVPALCMDGLCLVVTPLIALMKDQVEQLKKQDIRAAAIYSGMNKSDIHLVLENAVFDAYKFLYVSPERLASRIFQEKIKQTSVCLIAVDESHCISQWGYDFRPSYLKIAEIRDLLPGVPVLALTATATPEVVLDIQEKLHFPQPNVFRKSFGRHNLSYIVRRTENKEEQLLKILQKVQGSSVVYVRNRKKTKEVADYLKTHGIAAEHFHAGLKHETRDGRQKRWKQNDTRVIVSTNAFGMGIDKPDVRTVVHLDFPDSLEAYFQEAGRAGRDEQKAYAVLLYNDSDITKMRRRIADTFPPKEMVRKVYSAVCNFYQIAEGTGEDRCFPFDLAEFCNAFHLPMLVAFNSLKILQQGGYVDLSDEQENVSRVLFTVNRDELYQLQLTDRQDRLIHVLLRSYTGMFTDPAYISELSLAKRLELQQDEVYNELIQLAREHVIQYIPRKRTPFLTFTHVRIDASRLRLDREVYDNRRQRYVKRIQQVVNYARDEMFCRSQLLLAYFGEKDSKPCGHCDICLSRQEKRLPDAEFESIAVAVRELLGKEAKTTREMATLLSFKETKLLQVLRYLMDERELEQGEDMRFRLCSS